MVTFVAVRVRRVALAHMVLRSSILNYRSVAEIPKIEMLSIYEMLVLKIDHAILKIDYPAKLHNFRNLF